MSERLDEKAPAVAVSEPIVVQILDDGNAAALFIPEDTDTFPTPKQIHLAIENAGISYGIDDQAIDNLLKDQVRGEQVVFARGKPPAGDAGVKLFWHEQTTDDEAPKDIMEAILSADWDPSMFMAVEKGQKILTRQPAKEEDAGINVFGERIPLPGDNMSLPWGEGTRLSRDRLTLLADGPGVAIWVGGKIEVVDIPCIEGSVNTQTGNIKADGSIHIKKDVCAGYRVEALGDIYIGGNVEAADVYSRAGSVIVRNGVVGQNRARILAGENIAVGFIQDATIGAKQDVWVERYIINSAVTAGHYILATHDEGLVRGGTLFAEKRIEVRSAGAEGRIATVLRVSYTSPANVPSARYKLRDDQRRTRIELAYVQKRLAFLRLLKERMGRLGDGKEEQLAQLERRERILVGYRRDDSAREPELNMRPGIEPDEKIEAETIRIHDTIYPEVSVAIGDAAVKMTKERHDIIFFRTVDKLSFGPLSQALAKKM